MPTRLAELVRSKDIPDARLLINTSDDTLPFLEYSEFPWSTNIDHRNVHVSSIPVLCGTLAVLAASKS